MARLAHGCLNHCIRLVVHRSRGLIQHKHLGPPQQRPCHAQQLPLPHAQAAPLLPHRVLHPIWQLLDKHVELHGSKRLPLLLLRVLIKGIQVVGNAALKEHRLLGDNGECPPELLERNVGNVNSVHHNLAAANLRHAVQAHEDRALACSRAPANPDLLPRFDRDIQVLQHQWQALPVSHGVGVKHHLTPPRPVRNLQSRRVAETSRRQHLRRVVVRTKPRLLGLDRDVLGNALNRVHLRLSLRRHSHHPPQAVSHRESQCQTQPHQRRSGFREPPQTPRDHSRQRCPSNNQISAQLQPHRQPPVAVVAEREYAVDPIDLVAIILNKPLLCPRCPHTGSTGNRLPKM
mmetsp:Transcript_30657/g.77243  ORF Transcript_30657/g.77243 Transcript_30657/m.77243 type:complete len:346 (-) Transcript_30657:2695-3732(-)